MNNLRYQIEIQYCHEEVIHYIFIGEQHDQNHTQILLIYLLFLINFNENSNITKFVIKSKKIRTQNFRKLEIV